MVFHKSYKSNLQVLRSWFSTALFYPLSWGMRYRYTDKIGKACLWTLRPLLPNVFTKRYHHRCIYVCGSIAIGRKELLRKLEIVHLWLLSLDAEQIWEKKSRHLILSTLLRVTSHSNVERDPFQVGGFSIAIRTRIKLVFRRILFNEKKKGG